MKMNKQQQIQEILNTDYNTKDKIKINGEVFTPFKLIKEMLDKLPLKIWTDSEKTWLDPAAGLGNFHCIILERLMEGLKEKIPDNEKRYKHIVEKQLYFIELNPKSCEIIKKIFNPNSKYKLNLVCADTLDSDHSGWDEVGYMWDENDKKERKFRQAKKDYDIKENIIPIKNKFF